jgi:hypothetical protein
MLVHRKRILVHVRAFSELWIAVLHSGLPDALWNLGCRHQR